MSNNLYRFVGLEQSEFSLHQDLSETYFAMRELCLPEAMLVLSDGIDDVLSLLSESQYYVAQDLVSYKGKTITFRGQFAMAESKSLKAFLQHAAATDDLRPMLISPVFGSSTPLQVIAVTEDVCCLYSTTGKCAAPSQV
ncbi:hypothetical protein [Pseudomonas huanghezhanensis]|uniref:hypothetical protein n=1 Tax=Pseudomonas huanghezhanensis TaxID=3002903 RepID=UPI00228614B2|nr:hypothetical protein [Pseudomonas sp. BSw22131]